jgi:Arc/MetJ-type ribon-helix-helix transcriptional regulator
LGWALRYAPDPAVEKINGLIERHARECRDDYQRAAVRAWQVRALSERGLEAQARLVLAAALPVAVIATPQSSRAEALFLLFQAAFPRGPETVGPIAQKLLACRETPTHWRVSRNLACAMAMLLRHHPPSFERLRLQIADEKFLGKIVREAQCPSCEPRAFFW